MATCRTPRRCSAKPVKSPTPPGSSRAWPTKCLPARTHRRVRSTVRAAASINWRPVTENEAGYSPHPPPCHFHTYSKHPLNTTLPQRPHPHPRRTQQLGLAGGAQLTDAAVAEDELQALDLGGDVG